MKERAFTGLVERRFIEDQRRGAMGLQKPTQWPQGFLLIFTTALNG